MWLAGYINKFTAQAAKLDKVFLASLAPCAVQKVMINSPRFLLSLGLALMLLGIVLPFLMVIRVLESTFFLNFFSWGASVAGLSFGTIGFALWSRDRTKSK